MFALGLAIYETNEHFRRAFNAYYHLDKGAGKKARSPKAAHFFLEYWGLTSLFHDIGYPFELPFEQVMSYFEVNKQERGRNKLYIAYRDIDAVTALGDEAKKHFETLYGCTFHTIFEVLAYDITQKLGARYGFSEGYMMNVLEMKPIAPERFSYFMDHSHLFQKVGDKKEKNGNSYCLWELCPL